MSFGVGFDLDHTLLFDNKLERVAFMHLLELALHEGGHTLGTLADEVVRIDALLEEQRRGAFTIEEAVRRFVREHGLSPEERHVERFRAIAVEMVGEFVTPFPGSKKIYGALRERGYAVAVLSNGWNPLQIRKAQRCGFIGPVVASSDVGEQKPAPRAFEALLEALGTQPQDTWYVGDDPLGDIEGARAAGIRAVWMNAEHKTYPPELPPPAHTIHSLDELLDLLAATERVS